MEPRIIATSIAGGRLAIGLTLMAAPAAVARHWVGPDGDRVGAKTLASGLGVRDFVLGVGVLSALREGEGVRQWLIASAVADLGDLLFTLRERDGLPGSSVAGTAALAGGSAVAGAWLAAQGDW